MDFISYPKQPHLQFFSYKIDSLSERQWSHQYLLSQVHLQPTQQR